MRLRAGRLLVLRRFLVVTGVVFLKLGGAVARQASEPGHGEERTVVAYAKGESI